MQEARRNLMKEIDSHRIIILEANLGDFESLFQIHANPAPNRYNPTNW